MISLDEVLFFEEFPITTDISRERDESESELADLELNLLSNCAAGVFWAVLRAVDVNDNQLRNVVLQWLKLWIGVVYQGTSIHLCASFQRNKLCCRMDSVSVPKLATQHTLTCNSIHTHAHTHTHILNLETLTNVPFWLCLVDRDWQLAVALGCGTSISCFIQCIFIAQYWQYSQWQSHLIQQSCNWRTQRKCRELSSSNACEIRSTIWQFDNVHKQTLADTWSTHTQTHASSNQELLGATTWKQTSQGFTVTKDQTLAAATL